MKITPADKWFSMFIRLRDADENGYIRCISCGRVVHWKKADCGHFVKRQHMALRFNEQNTAGQCKFCNNFEQGNDLYFAEGIDRKYGAGTADKLRAMQHQTMKFTAFELKQIAEYYKQKVKEYETRTVRTDT